MTPQQAQEIIRRALSQVAPDADLEALSAEADFRDALELDSLDFLTFVERLGDLGGYRVEEDDYPAFTSIASGADFLAARSGHGTIR